MQINGISIASNFQYYKSLAVKINNKIIIGIAAVLVTGTTIYFIRKHQLQQAMLHEVSEEGYETAQDILYPLKSSRFRRSRFVPPYFRNRGMYGL